MHFPVANDWTKTGIIAVEIQIHLELTEQLFFHNKILERFTTDSHNALIYILTRYQYLSSAAIA